MKRFNTPTSILSTPLHSGASRRSGASEKSLGKFRSEKILLSYALAHYLLSFARIILAETQNHLHTYVHISRRTDTRIPSARIHTHTLTVLNSFANWQHYGAHMTYIRHPLYRVLHTPIPKVAHICAAI